MANEPEARPVVLPQELWRKADARPGASGTGISAIIEKALLAYFDLAGGAQMRSPEGGRPEAVKGRMNKPWAGS